MSDAEAVVPFIREERFANHERRGVSFVHFPNAGDHDEKVKFMVPIYSGTDEEDAEAFFETFMTFQKAMKAKQLWNDAMVWNTHVPQLFTNFDLCLDGIAKLEWSLVLATQEEAIQWKDFKHLVSRFITEKVLGVDAYERQVTYMENRKMPVGMQVEAYYKRLQTMDFYLPYMLTSEKITELSDGAADSMTQVWSYGQLRQTRIKEIFLQCVPKRWRDSFDLSALSRHSDISAIVQYFAKLEQMESRKRLTSQRGGSNQGRRAYDNRRYTNYNNYNLPSNRGGELSRAQPHQGRQQNYNNYRFQNFQRGGARPYVNNNRYQNYQRGGARPGVAGRSDFGRGGGRFGGRFMRGRVGSAHQQVRDDYHQIDEEQDVTEEDYYFERRGCEDEAPLEQYGRNDNVDNVGQAYLADEAQDVAIDDLVDEWDENLWLDPSDSAQHL